MPDLNLAQIAGQFLGAINPAAAGGLQTWAIRGDAIAESLAPVRDARANGGRSNRRGDLYGDGSFMRRAGSVAIVPIMGPLVARTNSSYWSYDEIIANLRTAAADETISAILLDIDSPGGQVANVEAAAEAIAAANAVKPVTAFCGGLCASAAYWLASNAGEIVAAPTTLVGSVGALIRYMDIEGIFTNLGARVVEVVAKQSPNKRLDPNSEEGRAELQAIADHGGEMFLAGLERSRGVDRETLMANYGQGLVFPAGEALKRGMIDRISSFEETLSGLADRSLNNNRAGSAAVQSSQETIMANKENGDGGKTPAAVTLTVDSLRADHGDLVTAIEQEAMARGAEAERNRILGIEQTALAGHDDLVATMKADGKTTPAEAAVRILAAEKEKAAERTSALAAMDAAAAGVVSTPSGDQPAAATTPEGWAAEWQNSDKLKAEYPTAEAYVAIKKRNRA